MTTYIGLFRGINLGGNRMPMKELAKLLTAAGLEDVRTYIASGNIVFRSAKKAPALRKAIEALAEANFGFHSKLLLLTHEQLEKLIDANPYRDRAHGGKAQHFFFLHAPAKQADRPLMDELRAATEEYALTDDVCYFYAPDGVGLSKLAAKIDRCLKVDLTARNLNTVHALRDMAAEVAE
jgi:uncharacterized protein (DUF1697 family)